MSDKESSEEETVPKANDETKTKGQKRKRPAVKATPSKKKSKSEEPPVRTSPHSLDDTESDEGDEVPVALLERSPEVTGTRVRKQVERLVINTPSTTESAGRKNEILPGKGVKLGTSPKILAQLQSVKHSEMVLLHRLLFKRPGTAHEIKKNIREFSGYPFNKEEKEFESRKHTLEKNTLTDLKFICQMLCLEKSGTKEGIIERILDFCLCPNPSTQPVAKKSKKSKEKKKKSPSKSNGEKTPRSSPKKNITSNETIEDSSSDSSSEDESEKEESPVAAKKIVKKAATPKPSKESVTPKVNKEAKTPKANKDKDTPAPKSKKKSPKKSPKKAEIKIKLPPVNKAKKKLAPLEINESEEEEKTTEETPIKKTVDEEMSTEETTSPSPSSKKSPSTEKSKHKSPSLQKKSTANSTEPTNDELVNTIKQILKDANLQDMTMKNLCRQVYNKFPEFDLEKNKKDFIRSAAKEILGNSA